MGIDLPGVFQAGAGRTVIWSEFNMPNQIYDAANNESLFRYGPDRSRYSHAAASAATADTVTTLYLGGLFERITKTSISTTEYRHYIVAGGSAVAIHTEWSCTYRRQGFAFGRCLLRRAKRVAHREKRSYTMP